MGGFRESGQGGKRLDGCKPAQLIRPKRRLPQRVLHEEHDLVGSSAAPESYTGRDHGFVTTHCVTGIAARQPCMPPTRSRREIARRRIAPPYRA